MFVPHTRAAIRHMLANRQGGIMKVKSRIDSIETMSNEEVLQYAETLLIQGSVNPILYSMTDRREMAQFLIRLYMCHQESCKNFLQKSGTTNTYALLVALGDLSPTKQRHLCLLFNVATFSQPALTMYCQIIASWNAVEKIEFLQKLDDENLATLLTRQDPSIIGGKLLLKGINQTDTLQILDRLNPLHRTIYLIKEKQRHPSTHYSPCEFEYLKKARPLQQQAAINELLQYFKTPNIVETLKRIAAS